LSCPETSVSEQLM